MNENLKVIKAVLLYVLQNGSQKVKSNVYYIVKTLFFAQQKHLAKFLCPIYNDHIIALKFGPVPSQIYDVLKMSRGDVDVLSFHAEDGLQKVSDAISFTDEMFVPKEKVDMDYLSPSNVECLDAALEEVEKLSFEDILDMTHSAEWQRAYSSKDKTMDTVAIAREGGANEAELDYLKNNILFADFVS